MSSFGFGAPATTTAAGGFSFGATTTPAVTGFNFGTPAATAAAPAAAPAAFSFGAKPVTTTATLSFGQPGAVSSAAPSFGFGATATTTAPLNFAVSNPTQPAATQIVPITFASPFPATASIAPQTTALPTFNATTAPAFGIPSTVVAPTTSSLTGGIFGAKTTAATFSTPTLSLGGSTGLGTMNLLGTTTTASTSLVSTSEASAPKIVGLGGVDINATQPKTIEGKNDGTKVKEGQTPHEIYTTLDTMKNYIKQQKILNTDIARTSHRKLFNVSSEIQEKDTKFQEMRNNLDNSQSSIKLLRNDTSELIQHADIAQRTHETPPGLQFENDAPLKYIINLIQKYEVDLIKIKHHVEMTEKNTQTLSNPQSFNAEDLKKGLQHMYESFVALAGRVHETHQLVETNKEKYLNLRKYLLHDKRNVFEENEVGDISTNQATTIVAGPTPFSKLGNMNLGLNMSKTNATATWPSSSTTTQSNSLTGGGFGLSVAPLRNAQPNLLFGSGIGGGGLNFPTGLGSSDSGAFNLQKPPIGNKRNKH